MVYKVFQRVKKVLQRVKIKIRKITKWVFFEGISNTVWSKDGFVDNTHTIFFAFGEINERAELSKKLQKALLHWKSQLSCCKALIRANKLENKTSSFSNRKLSTTVANE